jgi:hypothetical protein
MTTGERVKKAVHEKHRTVSSEPGLFFVSLVGVWSRLYGPMQRSSMSCDHFVKVIQVVMQIAIDHSESTLSLAPSLRFSEYTPGPLPISFHPSLGFRFRYASPLLFPLRLAVGWERCTRGKAPRVYKTPPLLVRFPHVVV